MTAVPVEPWVRVRAIAGNGGTVTGVVVQVEVAEVEERETELLPPPLLMLPPPPEL